MFVQLQHIFSLFVTYVTAAILKCKFKCH